jgi:hypothetical protein
MLLPALPGALASDPPAADANLEARLVLAMDTPAAGRFDGNFSFFRYTLNGTAAEADSLRLALAGPDGPALRAELESSARAMFSDRFSALFPNDSLSSVSCRLDNSTLQDSPGTDALHPPLVVRAAGVVAACPRSFGLPGTADLCALVPLALADGACLFRELTIDARPGEAVALKLESFPGSVFNETGNGTLALALDNSCGDSPANRTFGATLRAGMKAPACPDSLCVKGTVDIADLSTVRINGSVEFCRADISGCWSPPEGVRGLSSVSGAALSELVRSGVLSGDLIYEYGVLPVQSSLQARLSALLNVSLSFNHSWSTEGNLTCSVWASSLHHPLFGLSPALVLGALRAGATYCFCFPVDIGWPVELRFLLPDGLRLDGLEAVNQSDGRPAFRWADADGLGSLSAELSSDRAPHFSGDDVSITVLADFSEPVPDTGKLLFEGTADVPVKVDVMVRMGVVAVPRSFTGYLPENLTLKYLTADMVRLLLSERIITSTETDSLLREVRPRLEAAMRAALGRSVQPDIQYVKETLEGYDLNTMDGSRPLEIHAWASGQRAKHLDLFKTIAASPDLAAITQDFAFSGISGWNVTYRMRFSPETHITSLRQSGVKARRGSEGGRDYFEVAFGPQAGSSNVTAELAPSPGLLLRTLGPVCAPALVLTAVAAALVFRRSWRRRKRRKGVAGAAKLDGEPVSR